MILDFGYAMRHRWPAMPPKACTTLWLASFELRDAPNRDHARVRRAVGSYQEAPPTEDVENEKSRSGSVVRRCSTLAAGTCPAAGSFNNAGQFIANLKH